jgi:hypothetical protein
MLSASSHYPARQICRNKRHSLRCKTLLPQYATQIPTYFTQHSIFLDAHKNYPRGATVAEPSFDADLHIEKTTIMFADVVESVRLIEQNETENINRTRLPSSTSTGATHCGSNSVSLQRRAYVYENSFGA